MVRRRQSAAVDRFQRARTRDESKALNRQEGPRVIVAASGMAEGGRVVHHLLHQLGDARNAVVFVGYQAAGTRGRALVDGADTVGLLGERRGARRDRAHLESLGARRSRRTRALVPRAARPARRIFLNHGEDRAGAAGRQRRRFRATSPADGRGNGGLVGIAD
jgi:metallo-beta-lactamase family protein